MQKNISWDEYMRTYMNDGGWDDRIALGLQGIAAEEPKSPARAAAAASFGGVLRTIRSEVRINGALEVMQEIGITPTITVAKHVMRQAFGLAVSSETLREYFADSERTAAKKMMNECTATLALPISQEVLKSFSATYEFFSQTALPARVEKIRALVVT